MGIIFSHSPKILQIIISCLCLIFNVIFLIIYYTHPQQITLIHFCIIFLGFVTFITGLVGGIFSLKRTWIIGASSCFAWGIFIAYCTVSSFSSQEFFSIYSSLTQGIFYSSIAILFSIISFYSISKIPKYKLEEGEKGSSLKNTKKLINDETDQLTEAKLNVQKHYTLLRDAYGRRLLSLFAVFFTLSQLLLAVRGEIDIPSIFQNTTPNFQGVFEVLSFLEWWNLVFIFLIFFFVLFFIIRTFFKFSLCCYYADHTLWVTKEDMYALPDRYGFYNIEELYVLVQETVGYKMTGQLGNTKKSEKERNRERVYGLIPYDVFIPGVDWAKQHGGYVICGFISFILVIFMLNILL